MCACALTCLYATMKRMCQIDDWQVAQATLVSKVHKKVRKKSSTNVPSVVHCNPDRKKCACTGVGCSCVRARARVCVCVCIMAAPSDGVALL